MSRGEIAVVYNDDGALAAGGAEDALAVAGVEGAVRGVVDALNSRGWRARAIAAPASLREVLAFVDALDCDGVFNLVESLEGDARNEAFFAAALELRGIPYTGSGPRTLALCLDKALARAVLAAANVPIARGALLASGGESLAHLTYPLLIKPSREDASHGIAIESVARDEAAARARARHVIERYAQPALVEEYIAGREFNVGLLEGEGPNAAPRILDLAEIDFTNFPAGSPRIVTYGAKWVADSAEWNGTRSVSADVDTDLGAALRAASAGAWRALGLRGYARVDIRVEDLAPRRMAVIDVNSNPDLSPDAGFALTAGRSGIPYVEFIDSILNLALVRNDARA